MNFSDFFTHKDEYVASTAKNLSVIQAEYAAGHISESECKELVQTALDVENVTKITDDINRQSEIINTLQTLTTIAKTIFKFI